MMTRFAAIAACFAVLPGILFPSLRCSRTGGMDCAVLAGSQSPACGCCRPACDPGVPIPSMPPACCCLPSDLVLTRSNGAEKHSTDLSATQQDFSVVPLPDFDRTVVAWLRNWKPPSRPLNVLHSVWLC